MEDIPEQFICPITMDIMKEPIVCQDGNTYEKSAIDALIRPISPLFGTPMDLSIKIPNRILKNLISDFMNNRTSKTKNKINNKINDKTSNKINLDIDQIFNNIQLSIHNNKYVKKTINCLQKIKIINTLELIVTENINELFDSIEYNKICYLYAIIYKKSKLLKWLIKNNYPIDNNTMNIAVLYGNKELVSWLSKKNITWDIYTFSYALNTKNLNFLKWLKNEKCFWGVLLDEHRYLIDNQIKDWLKTTDCPWIF